MWTKVKTFSFNTVEGAYLEIGGYEAGTCNGCQCSGLLLECDNGFISNTEDWTAVGSSSSNVGATEGFSAPCQSSSSFFLQGQTSEATKIWASGGERYAWFRAIPVDVGPVRFDLVQDALECGDRDVLVLSRTTSDPTECAKLAFSNPNCGKYFEVRKERSNCRCLPKQKKCAMSFDPKTILYALQETAYLKTCRWKSTRDRLDADGQHLVGWTCDDNEIITVFGINANENDVSKIQCCDLGGHSSVIAETCSFIRVGDQEFQPERASCNANDHLMVFNGAYDASKFDDDDYTEILVGKCCEVKCDAPWCYGKDWGINNDQCVTISADADNKEAQDLVCPDGTVVTEVVDGHSGAALGIQKVASVVCCALDVISQPSSAPSLSPTTTKPTNAPSLSPSTTEPTYAPSRSPTTTEPTYAPTRSPSKTPSRSPSKTPSTSPSKAPSTSPSKAPTPSPTTAPSRSPTTAPSQAPTSTAHCLLALFQCNPPLSDAEILQGIDECLPNCMVPSDYVVRRTLEGRLLSKNAQ